MNEPAAERLVKELAVKAEILGINALNSAQKTVVVAWRAYDELRHGGLRVLFAGASPLTATTRSLRTLGFEAAADACRQVAAEIFPDGQEPFDLRARWALVFGVDWKRFERQRKVVHGIRSDVLTRAIGRYVETHPEAFEIPRS